MSEITRRRRMAWIAAIRRPDFTFDKIPKTAKVCSLHFHTGKPAYEMYTSDPDWAPSLNLGYTVTPSAPPNHSILMQQIIPHAKDKK
ncbi:hypothetical protein WMY93_014601 [Mugilogobius chulae]|uniref:THAP-type domain-containing protein n=1 Tax=Mugilogobius chulae TaxID=88201 RepID=A0AAW0NVE6_9GOBI